MAQPQTHDSPPLSLMVLGGPAGGAPQLAGILQHLGCDLPLDSPQDTLESPAISALNAQVFGALGRAPSDLGLTPLIYAHITPYGRYDIDLETRIDYERIAA